MMALSVVRASAVHVLVRSLLLPVVTNFCVASSLSLALLFCVSAILLLLAPLFREQQMFRVVSLTGTTVSLVFVSLPEGMRTSDSVFGGCVFAEKPKLRVSFVCAKAVISACAASGQSRVFSFYVLTVLLLFASPQGFRVSLVANITDVFVLEALQHDHTCPLLAVMSHVCAL